MPLLDPDAVLDDLAVEAFLGDGGVAEVYRVRRSGRGYALKLARPGLDPEIHDALGLEFALQREIRSPYVVAVHELLEVHGRPAMLMELVIGRPLDRWLSRQLDPVPLATAVRIFAPLVDGVAAVHAAGIVHRDLKPENVVLTDDLAPKLTDFGMAKHVHTDEAPGSRGLSLHFRVFGTPAYMAPEQALASELADRRADLYALGCMLYEVLCDEVPYTADTPHQVVARAMRRDFVPVCTRRPELPPAVDRLMARLLEPDPARRLQEAQELREALEAL